jgi:hypothetical protein
MITVNIKPLIAARPFNRSAYSLKPNFGSSSWGVVVGCGCVIGLKPWASSVYNLLLILIFLQLRSLVKFSRTAWVSGY